MNHDRDLTSSANELADALVARDAAARNEQEADKLRRNRESKLERLLVTAKRIAADEVEASSQACSSSAAAYCSTCTGKAIGDISHDPRMPQTINYKQRYYALTKMQDRFKVAERIKKTIDLADKILSLAPKIDVDACFRWASDQIRENVLKIEDIEVVPAESEDEEDDAADDAGIASIEKIDDVLDGIFAQQVDEGSSILESIATEQDFEEMAQSIESALNESVERFLEANAHDVAGRRLSLSDLPRYDGVATCTLNYSVDELKQVAAQVRKSFFTFKSVIVDHGLFAAFLNDSDYGVCTYFMGGSTWTDSLIDDVSVSLYGEKIRADEKDIPVAIEEDEGGDSPKRVIARMEEFNAMRYGGIFDEDFGKHVDAFWYGFRKLMEFVNNLCDVDSKDFARYCKSLRKACAKQAGAFGSKMNLYQVSDWAKQVREMGQRLENV